MFIARREFLTCGSAALASGGLAALAKPGVAAEGGSSGGSSDQRPALSVGIALPAGSDGRRWLAYRGDESEFFVVLTNHSPEPLRLWREWCSWGYFCLRFEARDAAGGVRLLEKRTRGWDKNFPDFQVVPPGEHAVLAVRFGDEDVWEGFLPERAGADFPLTLTAIYAVEPDEDTAEHGVWTGRVESRPLTATVTGFRRG